MRTNLIKPILAIALVAVVAIMTAAAVRHFHKAGQIDAMTAQAMDMSQMRPPAGAAPVELTAVRRGSLADTVTYSGTIQAYNEQDITPRITGTVVSLPVYPGDSVTQGELVAQLDSAEVDAKVAESAADLVQARTAHQAALLTHHIHHRAALTQATSQEAVAQAGIDEARAERDAAQNSITDAQSSAEAAQANVDYWRSEIAREKSLADQGAVSQQEYQSELAQSQSAEAALSQARAKSREETSLLAAATSKLTAAQKQLDVTSAGTEMANADIIVAQAQDTETAAGAEAAAQAEHESEVVAGYTRITSPDAGVVTSRPVSPGTLVQPGTLILTVAEIDRVRVQANVAVTDMAGIHPGSPVSITVQGDGGGKPISASVTSVFPSANAETHTDIVEAVIPNPGHRLLPGGFVSVQITKGTAPSLLLVPASAIVEQGGQSFVWAAQGSGGTTATYECTVCHMHYTAAQAKANNYRDPMDGGTLVPLSGSTSNSSPTGALKAEKIAVVPGASDGNWTEIVSGALTAGQQVVTRGQADLIDGADVVSTAWNKSGPVTLPTAATANIGKTIYRCEKCGMTYSAADAKRLGYIDPMDGGKLVPVSAHQ